MERNNRPRRAMGGPHGMGAGERAKDFSGTMRRLLREMGRWRWSLIAVALLGVGSAAGSSGKAPRRSTGASACCFCGCWACTW